ncbi:MAG: shikimate kinase AroK [Porticoccus sp.]
MNTHSNIFLVGPMGSGKSTIGRILAEILDLKFIDLDCEVEERCGANISWIFDMEGEDGFRKRESRMLAELASGTGMVLATGGGAVIFEKNRNVLKNSGYVVYLSAPVGQLLERTSHDRSRPLLNVSNPREVLKQLVLDRELLYQEIADLVFVTSKRKPWLVANEIANEVRQFLG